MNNIRKKAKKRSGQGRKGRNNAWNDQVRAERNQPLTVPRGIFVIPDRIMTELVFWGIKALNIPNTGPVVSVRYRPSSVYDLDPLVANTTTPGFAEYAALYGSYRVFSSTITVASVNPSSTLGYTVVVVPLNNDPGSSPSTSVITSWVGNPYARRALVGYAGSPTVKVRNTMSTERIYGSKMVYFDDNFSSPCTSSPANNWYWAVGLICESTPGAAIVTTFETTLKIRVEFFSRISLQT